MRCAGCGKDAHNYEFCEDCLSWLMKGDTEFFDMEGGPDEG